MPNIKDFFEDIESPTGERERKPKDNIVDDLDENTLMAIGREVIEGYTEDKGTMSDWEDGVERGLSLVELEESTKDTPFPRAANYKSPSLMSAALKWSDRASTELLRGDELVKPKVIGKDPEGLKLERGERVSTYQNYQLNVQMTEWREEHDKLLYDLPYSGTVFKETTYDPSLERPRSDLVTYPNFVVNNNASSLERLPRFSKTFELTQNEIRERVLQGLWTDRELKDQEGNELDGNQTFIEQRGLYDVDEDGYKEPYTFVVHESTSQVMRMFARFEEDGIIEKGGKIIRIEPVEELTKYGFLRDPQGGFLDVGYGHLLSSMTEGINATTNMLLDAGKFANLQGGFLAKGFRKRKGPIRTVPGVWSRTDMDAAQLQNSMFPYQYKEPSPTLFSLLQFMISGSQELSASADLTSALGANAPATTTLALVQEQQLSAGAIILRVYRAMAREFKLLFNINAKFGDPEDYRKVLDDPEADFEADFEDDRMDLVPVANPEVSSRIQRIQQATAELQSMQAVAMVGGDPRPIVKNFYEALGSEDIEAIFPELPPEQQLQELLIKNPDLAELIMQEQERNQLLLDVQLQAQEREEARQEFELQLKAEEQERKNFETEVKADQTEAGIILDLEKAESEEVNNQIDNYTKLRGANNAGV